MLDLVATVAGVALFVGAIWLAIRVDRLEASAPPAVPLAPANEPMGGPLEEDPAPGDGPASRLRQGGRR